MHISSAFLLAIISTSTFATANTVQQDSRRRRALRFEIKEEMEKRQVLSGIDGLIGGVASASTSTTIAKATTPVIQTTTSAIVTTPAVMTTSAVAVVTPSSVVPKVTTTSLISSIESIAASTSVTSTGVPMTSSFSSVNMTSSSSSSAILKSSAISSSTPTSTPTTSTDTSTTAHGTTLVQTIITSVPGQTSSNSTSTNDAVSDSSSDLSTGAIVGISVVGGVVALAIGLFVLWKLKRKRFGGDYDADDAIKWPELNRHGEMSTVHPLPARPTGGHGLQTNAMERAETDLDGQPIHSDMMDNEFEYSYPPQHPNPSIHNYGADYYDRSPTIGGYTTDGAVDSYMSHGTGIATSEHGPFEDAAETDDSTLGRNRSLGGTRAFEVDGGQDEMRMMGGSSAVTGVGRAKSGRLL